MVIQAGQLDQRMTIQKPTETNTAGIVSEAWSDVATVWAGVLDQRGREFVSAKQVDALMDTMIRIRYRSGILPTYRLKMGSRIFNIVAAPNMHEGNEEILLSCKEEVAAA